MSERILNPRREYLRNFQRKWLAKRKADWIAEHGPCFKCGSDIDLKVTHADPSTKLYDIARMWSLALDNPKRISELAKCHVICDDCTDSVKAERIAQLLSRRKNHGNSYGYNQLRCRCDLCKEWRKLRAQDDRAKGKG